MAAINNSTSTESDHKYNCRWYPIYVKHDSSTASCTLNDTILFRNEDANLHDNIHKWFILISCIGLTANLCLMFSIIAKSKFHIRYGTL